MAKVSNLMAFGVPAKVADELINGLDEVEVDIEAAGSAITDAYALTKHVNVVGTTAASTGVQLPDAYGEYVVKNAGAETLSIYPHSDTGTINGGSAGAAVTLATTKHGICWRVSATDWLWIAID